MYRLLIILMLFVSFSCSNSNKKEQVSGNEEETEVITKRRADGTRSSVNQVDDNGFIHGIRVTYYGDGKTIHTKLTMKRGFKHGPGIRYYKNGQIYEYANFMEGERHGFTKKYYKDGKLLSECEYENGQPKPGLKEYHEDGTLVSSYPEIKIKEINLLEAKNRIDLEIYCPEKSGGVKFYLLEEENEKPGRVYLISENASASQRYYVAPGENLDIKLAFLAEITTSFGNILVKELSYHLKASNL